MFSLKNEKRYIKIILIAMCSIFFAICLFTIFKYGNSTMLGNIDKPDNDDAKFVRSAWILADTGKYIYQNITWDTTFMMPGLTYTLSFITLIFGKLGGLTAFRIIQAIIQTLSLLLVFFMGRKLFDSKVGIIAMVINSLCIWEIWTSNLILTESFFKFFVLNMIFFCIYALEENKIKYYIAAGIFWSLSTLFRPTIALFPIVILIMWIIKKYKFKDILKNTLLVSLIFCAALSPWWIRNYKLFNKFIPLTKAVGNPMLQGTFINYDQTAKAADGLDYSQFKLNGEGEQADNDHDIQISKYRLQKLFWKQPLQFIGWYTIGKTIYQIAIPFYWKEILGVHFYAAMIYYLIIMTLSIIGIIKYFKDKTKNKTSILLFLTIIYFILVYLPFYTCARYFYPAMPYVIIFSAYGLLYFINKNKLIKR